MFNNVKSKKRLTQVLVAFVIICMSVTGSFLLLDDTINKVYAEDTSVSTQSEWNNVMSQAKSGETWNIDLKSDIKLTATTGGKLAAVPAGVTVNLNMNTHNITWTYSANNGSHDTNIIGNNYNGGTYKNGEYWGLITNNGTLNINGTGKIVMNIWHRSTAKSDRNVAVQRSAAIVNKGTMKITSNITVDSYFSHVHASDASYDWKLVRDEASYSDLFLYNVGVYNDGGNLTTEGKINVATMAATSQDGETNGYAYSFVHGIYGGTVNVTGGNIYVDSFAGNAVESGGKEGAHHVAFATGVYSETAKISGNTNIKVLSKNWRGGNNQIWKSGADILFAAGLLYTGSNYPVVGPSVEISASFEHIDNNNVNVYVPGGAGISLGTGDKGSEAGTRNHYASAVVGVSKVQNCVGTHTSEMNYSDGTYLGSALPTDSVKSTDYKTAQSYYSGANVTVSAISVSNTSNEGKRYTSNISSGAPANTTSGDVSNNTTGNAGDYSPAASDGRKGSQYLVVYRFYKNVNEIESVSFTADTSKLKNEATFTVGSTANVKHGILADKNTKIFYTGGGETINSNFYSFEGVYYKSVDSSNSDFIRNLNDISDGKAKTPSFWEGSNTPLTADGIAASEDKTIIIYLDYEKLDPAEIDVVAADKGTGITEGSDTKEFTVPYTGANLIPCENFDFGIIDKTNNKVVTNDYNYLSESNSSKITVEYEYTSNNTTWTTGLPKDVGTYTIKVKVHGDDKTYNRQAKEETITATITPANVVMTGPNTSNSINGVYGATYNELFNSFNGFSLTNNGKALPSSVTGDWSISGVEATKVPDAGTYTNLKVVWTPHDAYKKNYSTAELPVSLVVAKREVNVTVGAATATYGNETFNSTEFLTYSNLPAIDAGKKAEWFANTTFTTKSNSTGATNDFHAGLAVGSYTLSIEETKFGGATNQNYIFTFATGTLEVQKRPIYYTAEAAGKTYDGNKNVTVTLRYTSGIFGGDPYESVYVNVPGTMTSANAGENKVTVDASKITVNSNYSLVISNASDVTVTVAKADPTGVAVVANPAVVEYDKTKTLKTVTLEPTATELAGSWKWETETAVPHVNQNKYVAVFTPADTTNYNTLKQDVTLTVEKKDVTVTVDAITVTYGDNVPVLTVKYNGFTGGDTLATIDYEGNATASTTYTPGSGVDKKYPISVASTLESENYNFVKKDSEITVTPKALTVTANNATITYGDPKPEFNASDVTVTGFYGSDSLSSINATVSVATTYLQNAEKGAAGAHEIKATVLTSNKNYTITCVPGTLTVNKAVVTITPKQKEIKFGEAKPVYTVSDADCTFNGFKYGQTISNIKFEGTPDVDFNTSYEVGSYVNTYPVSVDTTNGGNGTESANYIFVGASGTIKVVQATPSITTAPTASVVNSHSLADATFSNTAVVVNPNDSAVNVPGSFAFVKVTDVPTWGSNNSYEAVFTPDDTINYTTAKVDVKVTVTVKTISGTPVIQGSAMADSTLTVSLAAMDPSTASSYTYQWYADDAIISGATGTTYKISESNIGKRIHVVIDAIEANGFTGTATSAKTDAVIKALLETTAAQLKVVFGGVEYTDLGVDTTFADVEYDAMSHAGTVYIADGYNTNYFGTPVLKYNGSDKAPTAAGTYVVTVDVSTPDEPAGGYPENTYYGPATGIVVGKLTITRAPYTVTVLANDKFYDGTVTATAKITGLGIKNDDVYLADGARFVFANNDTNVGTNKPITVTNVTLLGKDAGNYEIVVNPATASILPRVIYYRARGLDKFYDGLNTVAVEFTYDAGKNGENSDWGYASVDNASTVYLTNGTAVATDVNAGNNIIIANIKAPPPSGTSSNNYEIRITNENSTVNIKKAPVTVTTPVINGIVYDSTMPLSTIDLSVYNAADGSYWVFDDPTIVPTVKQKTYAATYYSKNPNYEDETPGTITVNVTPKEVILTADDKFVTYGANAPTYTISASGFTGSDSLAMIGGNIKATSTYVAGSDVNSYVITINEALTRDNYTFVTRNGALTVSHATINVTAKAVDKVYDGNTNVTVNFSKLNTAAGVFANDLGKVGLSFEKTTGQSKTANAGTTTVSYTAPTLIGEKAKNYLINVTPKSGVLTVVIAKADMAEVVFPTNGQVEYGFDLTFATFETEGIGEGTFEYENAKLVVPDSLGLKDTYKVIFTPTDPNYNTQEKVVPLNVIKCTLSYVVGISGKLQSGQTLTVVTEGLPSKAADFISYQWYRYDGKDFEAIKGANGKNYVATDDDIGYTLVVMTSFDGSSPYIFADGVTDIIKDAADIIDDIEGIVGESDDTIKEINLTFWQRLMNWLYRIIAVLTGVRLGGGLGI